MSTLDLTTLPPSVSQRTTPFFEELLSACGDCIHSLYVTGSAVTPDFSEKTSNVNSLIVLRDLRFDFISFLAPLGKKYKSKGIAAPLVMTQDYIRESLDVFPVEFLDLKLIHKTVYGPDLFAGLTVGSDHLRLQAEREVKSRLIGLWQGYITSMGDREAVAALLTRSLTGSMPLFRAVLALAGKEPHIARHEVVEALASVAGIGKKSFADVLAIKERRVTPAEPDIKTLFEDYYRTLEALSHFVNGLPH